MNDERNYINPLEEEVSASDFVNLGSLAEDMVYLLPGCSDLMIRKTLQTAYRDFCETTWALKATSTNVLVEDECSYRIVIPSQTYVFRVVNVKKGSSLLVEGRDYTANTGQPIKVVLLQAPTSSDSGTTLETEVVCVPTRGSEDLPTWFSDMYGNAIISGALFRLFSMGGKPWSDDAQARTEAIAWQNALNDASAKTISGSQVGNSPLNAINFEGML